MSTNHNFDLIRNARVEVQPDRDMSTGFIKGVDIAVKSESGRVLTHRFDGKSAVAQSIYIEGVEQVRRELNGGAFFFVDGILVDYRKSTPGQSIYKGFIHSDEQIIALAENLGCEESKTRKGVNSLFAQSRGAKSNGYFLGGVSPDFDLNVESLGEGGQFKNRFVHKWSPFSPNLINSLEVERLICLNGMTAISELIARAVPMLNNIEENLSVVFNQLRPSVTDLLHQRMEQMAGTRASVYELARAAEILESRGNVLTDVDSAGNQIVLDNDSFSRIDALRQLVDPQAYLSGYYSEDVFKDTDRSKIAPGHMDQFALYNIITETASHYGSDEGTNMSLMRLATRLMFDSLEHGKRVAPVTPVIEEADHTRAFYSSAEDILDKPEYEEARRIILPNEYGSFDA